MWRLALLAEPGGGHRSATRRRFAPAADRSAVEAVERWRARRALRALLEPDDPGVLAWKLRARFERLEHRFVHPSTLERLAADRRLVVSGERAAAALGADLVPAERLDAYVLGADLPELDRRHVLRRCGIPDANVVLRVAGDAIRSWASPVAPRLLVVADLALSRDARARGAAHELLRLLQVPGS